MPNRKNKTVWERVEEALQDKGLPATQKKAADLAGVKQPSVSKWTKPDKFPEMPTAVRLAEKLGVSVQWLLDGRGPKRPGADMPPDLAELAGFWDRLTSEARAHLLGTAKLMRSTTFTGDEKQRKEYQESIARKERAKGDT